MKLNKEGREELRGAIRKELEGVPEGQKIELPQNVLEILILERVKGRSYFEIVFDEQIFTKINLETFPFKNYEIDYSTFRKFLVKYLSERDVKNVCFPANLLEEMIFEEVEIEGEKNAKIIYWTHPVLTKVDLSRVDFSNVIWTNDRDKFDKINKKYFPTVVSVYPQGEYAPISLGGTNVKIDFSKSFETQHGEDIVLKNINLEGIDLSAAHIEEISTLVSSNLSSTGIVASPNEFPTCHSCDLSNNDLSALSIPMEDVLESGFSDICLTESDISNTGLKIIYDITSYKSKNIKKDIKALLESGRIYGCYINDRLVLYPQNREELQAKAKKIKEEYENYKKQSISSAVELIRKRAK